MGGGVARIADRGERKDPGRDGTDLTGSVLCRELGVCVQEYGQGLAEGRRYV